MAYQAQDARIYAEDGVLKKTAFEEEFPAFFPLSQLRLNADTLRMMLKTIYDTMRTQHKIALFTPQEAIQLEEQLRTGFKVLHQQGFYHRDVGGNPRNLMLRKNENADWEPVLIDFGKSVFDPSFAKQ
ncbi:MAG: serine/threonine-protein kinase [bacterium]|nr:serine/threonine-protein kinase [bacterium]